MVNYQLENKKLTDVFTDKELEIVIYDIRMAIVNMYSWLEGGEIDSHSLECTIRLLMSLSDECVLTDNDKYH